MMQSVQVHIPALLRKVQKMSNDHMENVNLTISAEVIDQCVLYPAYLHFEAYTKDGAVSDYESIDALSFYNNPLDHDGAVS